MGQVSCVVLVSFNLSRLCTQHISQLSCPHSPIHAKSEVVSALRKSGGQGSEPASGVNDSTEAGSGSFLCEQGLGGPGKGIPDRGHGAEKITALHDVIKKVPQGNYHQAAELLVGQTGLDS